MSARSFKVRCAAFGVPFCLVAESEELLAEMREQTPWSTAICDDGEGREFALRQEDGSGYSHSISGEGVEQHGKAALVALARELMVHVAEFAPEHVFVHAGVVAWGRRALVLPGPSFAGKTTLVAELVRAGATYYSDEYAVLDAEGRVHPYARALSMRRPGEEEQRSVNVAELGGCAGAVPLRAVHVVFTEYVPGAQWAPKPVSAGMAALEMLRHAVPVQRSPARVMAALAKMMATATAVRSTRGEAAGTARLLLAMMDEGETRA